MKPVSEYSFENPEQLFASAPNLRGFSLAIRESFSVLEKSRKVWRHFMMLQKLYFCWIFPNIHTLPNSTGSQLSRISRTINKLGKEVFDTCGYVNFSVEISELVFSANQGVKKSKKEKNFPFCYFLAFVHILILKENSY